MNKKQTFSHGHFTLGVELIEKESNNE